MPRSLHLLVAEAVDWRLKHEYWLPPMVLTPVLQGWGGVGHHRVMGVSRGWHRYNAGMLVRNTDLCMVGG